MGPSILEQTSPPRSRDIDKPMSPLPTPFSPTGKVGVAVPVLVSPEDRVVGRTSGPLTATPLHPVRLDSLYSDSWSRDRYPRIISFSVDGLEDRKQRG